MIVLVLSKDLEAINQNRALLYDRKISTYLEDGQKSFQMLRVRGDLFQLIECESQPMLPLTHGGCGFVCTEPT